MTLEELSRIYYIRKEIDYDREKIAEYRRRAASAVVNRQHAGGARTGVSDKVGDCAAAAADLERQVRANLRRLEKAEAEIMRYINSVEDPQLRLIFKYRFLECLPWFKIAMIIGGGNTEAGVKMQCYRFLNKNP